MHAEDYVARSFERSTVLADLRILVVIFECILAARRCVDGFSEQRQANRRKAVEIVPFVASNVVPLSRGLTEVRGDRAVEELTQGADLRALIGRQKSPHPFCGILDEGWPGRWRAGRLRPRRNGRRGCAVCGRRGAWR